MKEPTLHPLDPSPAPPVSLTCAATFARGQCQIALESGEPALIALAVGFVRRWASDHLEEQPTSPELRLWHELVLDLAISIEERLPDTAAALESLAAEIYGAVTLANRNPRDEIIWRPTVRRVLEALISLGDGCTQSDIRAQTGYGVSHLSNIVSLLRGYKMIDSRPDQIDGRSRRLFLTDEGRAHVQLGREFGLPEPPSASRLPRVEKIGKTAPSSAETYQPPARVTVVDRTTFARARTSAPVPATERQLEAVL